MDPAEVRGTHGDEDTEHRQVHFVTERGAWRFTYDTIYGHALRIAVPTEQLDLARARAAQAVDAMGLVVLKESS
jgi:hypothetical protein